MKIRTRLALRFTLIVASILLLFSTAVYYFSSTYRHDEFYSRLTDKVYNTGKLLIDVQEVDYNLFKIIDRNTASLPQEQILVYNSKNEELYNTIDEDTVNANTYILNKIREEKILRYDDGEKEALGIFYQYKEDNFVIIASAKDVYGLSKLSNLKLILIIGCILSIIVAMISGWIYSGQALSPISEVIQQVDNITANDLGKRVNTSNNRDEIAQLALTFNRMLERLQNAFELQKSFVSNASHELRTPLTAVTGQIEVALLKVRSSEEYQSVLLSLLEDMRNLNKLSNGLLALTQADISLKNANISLVRIDELLWQARNELLKSNPSFNINIQIIDFTEDESKLIIRGNEFLLKSAIINLMENACKFSNDHSVLVTFSVKQNIELVFSDKGIGIPENEIRNILQPFYRATNAKPFAGHGIGLSLTHKIVTMHKGAFHISSSQGGGTNISIFFPN